MNALRLILQYITLPFRALLKGPTYLIAAPRRVWGMKPPARAATIVAAGLITCTAVVVLTFVLSDKPVHGAYLSRPGWIAGLASILIATPVATYFLVRLWLEGDVSKYPDVDRAWDAGVQALAEEGIDLTDLPLYVVLGVANESDAGALISAARISTVVPGLPKGRSPLHWYASSDAIYLVCTGLGRLGRLSELAAASGGGASRPAAAAAPHAVAATMVAAAPVHVESYPGVALPSDQSIQATRAGGGQILGTLVASPGVLDSQVGGQPVAAAGGSSGMSRKEADEQSDRLAHVFSRLRRTRQPYCANNGLLTVLPHAILADVVFAKEVPEAVRADLAVVREASGIASSVTMLVTGMETEEGFTELVRRVGVERARSSRFGKGFDVWNIASDENLDALSLHACGSFEDWVYTLFSSDTGNEQRSNGKLYAMLCRIRRHFQPRLRGVLVNGYAIDPEAENEPRLFSGCYFAATGKQGESQAFVRSVFDKLDQLAEELQWGGEALRQEEGYRLVTWVLTAVNAVLLAFIGYLVYQCIVLLTQ